MQVFRCKWGVPFRNRSKLYLIHLAFTLGVRVGDNYDAAAGVQELLTPYKLFHVSELIEA